MEGALLAEYAAEPAAEVVAVVLGEGGLQDAGVNKRRFTLLYCLSRSYCRACRLYPFPAEILARSQVITA